MFDAGPDNGGYFWEIGNNSGFFIGSYDKQTNIDYGVDNPRNGWFMTIEGMITVPMDAPAGLYTGLRRQDWEREVDVEFEIECLTVTLSVKEIYRDEAVYRLSCTATPAGGITPYSYIWSGTVGSLLNGQGTATVEIEIPATGVGSGSITVAVEDSSDPVCNASASFDVCDHVTCEFSTALISTSPTGATGPYVYECTSSSQSAFGPLEYEWSPAPVWLSADDTVARFSFSDDDEHSIDLTVIDAVDCHAFKTHKVGGYEFVILTDPAGEDTGTVQGTRDTMQFEVKVKAQITGNFIGPPPAQVTFEFLRPATGGTNTATGTLVAGSSPPRYEFTWDVTQQKGRWQIKLSGYLSNTANFKINKRQQIVEVANSWVGADRLSVPQGSNCEDLVGSVYSHLGLAIDATTPTLAAESAPLSDSQPGSIILYHSQLIPTTPYQHVGIQGGDGIVDQNCGEHPGNNGNTIVCTHSATASHLQSVTPTLDHYSIGPVYRGTQEMQDLDNE